MISSYLRKRDARLLAGNLYGALAALSLHPAFASVRRAWMQALSIGVHPEMGEYERRKLTIFNQLNLFGIFTGLVVPFIGSFENHLPAIAFVVASSPALISLLVLLCNHFGNYSTGRILFFVLFPLLTSLAYAADMNIGVELFFILYGVLSVFFLQQLWGILLCFTFSMALYLAANVLAEEYLYELREANFTFYFLNHLLATFFIFYGLYLIKRENGGYQVHILKKNRQLYRINLQMKKQKEEIGEKAALLQQQAAQLESLDQLKNKLFSVISHDLKAPIYALRNLFINAQQFDMPAAELKKLVPDIVNDLNYTTSLMENLLQWAKMQMRSDTIRPQVLDLSKLVSDVLQLLRLQAESKKIRLSSGIESPVFAYADKDMIQLVLRNLVSNAIKFTPEGGSVKIDAAGIGSFVEVTVEDSGIGMSMESIRRLSGNQYFTTTGTANETGTGLGLMLCREFLNRNGGNMLIESTEGVGSVFSFTLPAGEEGE
ncbi:MAG TPA: HAMP domain-containing sensor histidine kinase [Chitinophagaceae bacterium]|jgi:signal transduction histidine kinase|nr:HAMP domain-containing sensor histidine kinase [Chitinophagaceae bacterium]